MNLIHPEIP